MYEKTTCSSCRHFDADDKGRPVNGEGQVVGLCQLTRPEVRDRIDRKLAKKIMIDEDLCPDCHHLVSVHVAKDDDAMTWPPQPIGTQRQAQVDVAIIDQVNTLTENVAANTKRQDHLERVQLQGSRMGGPSTNAEFYEIVVCDRHNMTPRKMTMPDVPPGVVLSDDTGTIFDQRPACAVEAELQKYCNELFASVNLGFVDTHKSPYLDGKKPDISFLASFGVDPRPSNVGCFVELKLEFSPTSASDKGQCFKYHEPVLTSQEWCNRHQVSTILIGQVAAEKILRCQLHRTTKTEQGVRYSLSEPFDLTKHSFLQICEVIKEEREMVRLYQFEYPPKPPHTDGKDENNWRTTCLLGQGKTAWVFACQDDSNKQAGVLKMAKTKRFNDALKYEASILSRLADSSFIPSVCGVVAISGSENQALFMGERLRTPCREKPRFALCYEDVQDIAQALFDLHNIDYVHCDVSVRNLMIQLPEDTLQGQESRGFLVDFGFARSVDEHVPYRGTRATASDKVLQALASEEADGKVTVDFEDDLISLYRSVYVYNHHRGVLVLDSETTDQGENSWPRQFQAWWKTPGDDCPELPGEFTAVAYREFGARIGRRFGLPPRSRERATGEARTIPGSSPTGSPNKENNKDKSNPDDASEPKGRPSSTPQKPTTRNSAITARGHDSDRDSDPDQS